MRIIAQRALRKFWERHSDAEQPLKAWYAEVSHANWETPQDILDRFSNADILPGNRAVFNKKGNRYRIVGKIHFNSRVVFIRFVGTHAEYDEIDAESI